MADKSVLERFSTFQLAGRSYTFLKLFIYIALDAYTILNVYLLLLILVDFLVI
jgi:hypothetical protein